MAAKLYYLADIFSAFFFCDAVTLSDFVLLLLLLFRAVVIVFHSGFNVKFSFGSHAVAKGAEYVLLDGISQSPSPQVKLFAASPRLDSS